MNGPFCSACALAWAMGEFPDDVIDGLNGLTGRPPELGHHIQELQQVALDFGFAASLYFRKTELAGVGMIPEPDLESLGRDSVLFSATHAYGRAGKNIHDPRGFDFEMTDEWFDNNIECFLMLYQI